MAIEKLNATQLRNPKPGRHGDGGGLWLYVKPNRAAYWVFRYRLHKRDHWMGLGPFADVTAEEARAQAREYRNLKRQGRDPLQERGKKQGLASVSFRTCAERTIAAKRPGWSNVKHAQQWESTLATYAFPVLGDMPVESVETDTVLRVLEPIWTTKTETASRLRQRIEAVLDYAHARGLRRGDNPARWRGHLETLLPHPEKVKKVAHHPALPYARLPAFMAELVQRDGIASQALAFTVLMAMRTEAILRARYNEIADGVWNIPAERMKAGKPHSVPLSRQALELIEALPRAAGSPYLFPGQRASRPISNGAMASVLKRMGLQGKATVHGFRASFRTWADEETAFQHDLKEAAMAHVIKNKGEKPYRRGEMLERRRELMQTWADFCLPPVLDLQACTPAMAPSAAR